MVDGDRLDHLVGLCIDRAPYLSAVVLGGDVGALAKHPLEPYRAVQSLGLDREWASRYASGFFLVRRD